MWCLPIELFWFKSRFVWINGYDFSYFAYNNFQGATLEELLHCHTSICSNFDGSTTMAIIVELLLNFSHSLSCSSIGELRRSCSSSWTNFSSHATCYQWLELLLIFLMVFFTHELVSLNGELGDNFWCCCGLTCDETCDNFMEFNLYLFIISWSPN
jgi:hypothetical protein